MFNKIKNKGFTIIELLIVVLIIGVLTAIALPMYFNAVEKSRTSEPLQTLSTIAKAQQRHKLQDNVYTDQIDSLDITLKDYSSGTDASGSEFDSEFFNYSLGSESASATRKGEDDAYILGVNYTTNQLSCTPAEHKICLSLALGEGSPISESPHTITPTCSTITHDQGGGHIQSVSVCDYGGEYTTYNERWCNGSAAHVIATETTYSSSSNTCVEGEMEVRENSYITTTRTCTTSGSNSNECIPNTYSNAAIQIGRPMDEELRSQISSWYYDRNIETIISCATNSSDGSCLRYSSMYEFSDAAPGGCYRYCNEIDSTGFDCQTWGSWDCDD